MQRPQRIKSLQQIKSAPSELDNHKLNNIPDVLYRWQSLTSSPEHSEKTRKRTEQSFYVPVDEIIKNDWDLSISRYKEVVYEEVKYDEPPVILKRIKELQQAMDKGIADLEALL